MALPNEKPIFVDENAQIISQEMKAYFEAALDKKIEPAQIEQLLINGWANRESIIRNQINNAAVQNLVRFATFPMLDYIGELLGVTRIAATPAGCAISMTFQGNTVPIVIPEGTRIASTDQKVFFRTVEAVTIPALQSSASVAALCETEGVDGNDYAPGEISVIQDPQPYLISAVNSDVTVGGAPEESDAQMRERIRLAPYQFSTAGPTEAYKFWARTAHPSIIDVGVPIEPVVPGRVDVYPLIDSGEVTPTPILDAVRDILTATNIRPLCDTVNVQSPTRIEYVLDIRLTLFNTAVQGDVEQRVLENAQSFVFEKRSTLGQDIIDAQVKAAIMDQLKGSIYNVVLFGFSDIVVPENSYAFCTAITITTTGLTNG